MTTAEKEKKIRLMLRQVADAQVQAEKILKGDDSPADIETFARFSAELNEYIRKYAGSAEVVTILDEVPKIQYKKMKEGLLYFFMTAFVSSAVTAAAGAVSKKTVLDQVRRVREKYAVLELRLRAINF